MFMASLIITIRYYGDPSNSCVTATIGDHGPKLCNCDPDFTLIRKSMTLLIMLLIMSRIRNMCGFDLPILDPLHSQVAKVTN